MRKYRFHWACMRFYATLANHMYNWPLWVQQFLGMMVEYHGTRARPPVEEILKRIRYNPRSWY